MSKDRENSVVNDAPATLQCGCRLVGDDINTFILLCPLHTAAPRMLAALEGVLELAVIPHKGKHGIPALLGCVLDETRAAIAMAKGD